MSTLIRQRQKYSALRWLIKTRYGHLLSKLSLIIFHQKMIVSEKFSHASMLQT